MKEEKAVQSTVPTVYNQRINAVEDRTSFAVKPPTKASADDAPAPRRPHHLRCSNHPALNPATTSMWTGRTLINGRGQSADS